MCCRWCANFFFGVFALIIVLELVAGVAASTAAAFYSESVNTWGYVIFVADISFVSFLTFYVGKQLFWNKTRNFTLNWICGMCTVFTAVIFLALCFLTEPYDEDFWNTLFVFRYLLVILGFVAAFYTLFLILGGSDGIRSSHDPSKSNDPIGLEPNKTGEERCDHGQGKTLEQSLTQIVNHVQNTPQYKQYRLHAVGSGTPFVVTMTN